MIWFLVGYAVVVAFRNPQVRARIAFVVCLFGGAYLYLTLTHQAIRHHQSVALVEITFGLSLAVVILERGQSRDLHERIVPFALAIVTLVIVFHDVWGKALSINVMAAVWIAAAVLYATLLLLNPMRRYLAMRGEKEALWQRYSAWKRSHPSDNSDTWDAP